jgi:nicotinate dehydrogenase subunit B
MLTRRGFVQAGGALFVSLGITRSTENQTSVDPTRIDSWIEIHSDHTIVVRTGRAEIGTGMSGYYTQFVAEELYVHPEMITLIMGDTDKTPDGGYSAGFLSGASNIRKASAYTYRALLDLAAAKLGVPVAELSVNDGIVSSRGRRIS